LLIINTLYSEEFLNQFTDPSIKSSLSPLWPDGYYASMPVLDANILCMYNKWRAEMYKSELEDVLGRTRKKF